MFKVNDYIMYGITGVCKIVDIKKENNNYSGEKDYYVLIPVYSKNTIIKIPVGNVKVPMRRLLSKADISFLISEMPLREAIWIENEKQRNEEFKSMLKSGDCEKLITLVKSIYLNKKNKKIIGKKLYKGDDEIMQTAERLLNEEFATILNILPEDVKAYISVNVPDEDGQNLNIS